jgi:transcriptional regulator with XRE-family HTH domain
VQGDDRKSELAEFLRSRRVRVRPSDVGLPTGPRRRTLGLRREEVAVLAGVSPTWYSYLEQGRDVTPSHEVLDNLAFVLRLTEDERQYLHMLVHRQLGGEAAVPAPDDGVLQRVMSVAATGPHPVYAANWLCDVLAWNDAAADWYVDFADLPPGRRNFLWWMLMEPAARERLVDWEEEARDLIGRFRAVSVWRGGHPRMRELVEDLTSNSAEFAKWWKLQDVRGQHVRPRVLAHPERGIRIFHLAVVYPSGQDETMIVFHPPAADPADPGDG